jgi:hypothetical protein
MRHSESLGTSPTVFDNPSGFRFSITALAPLAGKAPGHYFQFSFSDSHRAVPQILVTLFSAIDLRFVQVFDCRSLAADFRLRNPTAIGLLNETWLLPSLREHILWHWAWGEFHRALRLLNDWHWSWVRIPVDVVR